MKNATTISIKKKAYTNSSTLRHSRQETRLTDEHKNENIDKSRTPQNIVLVDKDVRKTFDDVYSEAVDNYNKNERNKTRHIGSMYDKVLANKKAKPYVEFVFSYGSSADLTPNNVFNKENIQIDGQEWNNRVEALKDFGSKLETVFPKFEFYHVNIHVDELNPHIHAFGIPYFDDDSKKLSRGFNFNKSMVQSAEEVGVKLDKNKQGNGSYSSMMNQFLQGYVKDEMILSYESVTKKKFVEDEKVPHNSLHIEEYKKAMKPINELHNTLVDYLQQLILATKQIEELKESLSLSKEQEDEVNQIVNSIDLDKLINDVNNIDINL